jgi:hypothetical protein
MVPRDVIAAAPEHRDFEKLGRSLARARDAERRRLKRWLLAASGRRWSVARRIWTDVVVRFPGVRTPACEDVEGRLALIAWSLPHLYVEVEANARGRLSWYGADRATGEHAGDEDVGPVLPEPFWAWMERIAHA